jgi:hypothetical protein
MAPIADSSVPWPVTTMTGTSGRCATMRSHNSSPLMPGICRSVSTVSKSSALTSTSASDGCVVTRVSMPTARSPASMSAPMSGSSSTMRTRRSTVRYAVMDARTRSREK